MECIDLAYAGIWNLSQVGSKKNCVFYDYIDSEVFLAMARIYLECD